ncbi:hypothetical protein Lepto7375DRAFT_7296 [Leptolyngbya sp. PCC 7375]|nr:hypothetical protein Lepto7375DRAFT_7296 [Leptolyngbya sp. PCC 7375]
MTSFNGVRARDSLLALRNYLETLLSADLGVFTSTSTPAIWVEPPFMTERASIEGVGVIVSRHEKNLSQQHVASIPQGIQQFDWEVVIRAYDKSAMGLVAYDRAIAKMRQAFSQFREIMLDSSEDVFPQVRYLLNSSRVINLLPKF